MNIIAKMKCESVLKTEYGEDVKLKAVYSDSPENKTFSAATPTAELSMSVTNKGAHGAFVPGKEYYVKFLPAEATS
jgi:hypothetical protein